jgi:hypothetical protein
VYQQSIRYHISATYDQPQMRWRTSCRISNVNVGDGTGKRRGMRHRGKNIGATRNLRLCLRSCATLRFYGTYTVQKVRSITTRHKESNNLILNKFSKIYCRVRRRERERENEHPAFRSMRKQVSCPMMLPHPRLHLGHRNICVPESQDPAASKSVFLP